MANACNGVNGQLKSIINMFLSNVRPDCKMVRCCTSFVDFDQLFVLYSSVIQNESSIDITSVCFNNVNICESIGVII